MSQIDGRASYVLTFRDPSPDHGYHSIQLKSLRPALKIVYRRSYRIPDETERTLDAVVGGFLIPPRADTVMDASIQQSAATDSKSRPATHLAIDYAPPLETGAARRVEDEARYDASVLFDVAPRYAWSIAVTDEPTGLTSYVMVPAIGKP